MIERQVLEPARRVGIVAHMGKPDAARVVRETVAWLIAHGASTVVSEGLAEVASAATPMVPLSEIGERSDVVISIGGDGTLIRTAHAVGRTRTPILGVNLGGKLGFLTETDPSELPAALQELLAGGAPVEERMNLAVEIQRGGEAPRSLVALNDCAVSRGDLAGILEFSVHVGAEYLGTFLADGVIVSTPTGSTAYSLSAGGPILQPEMRALVLTPICPHALSLRPLVLGEDHRVEVRVLTPDGVGRLSVDGREGIDLAADDRVVVSRSPHTTRLVRLGDRSFYALLREKFQWGGWHSGARNRRRAP